MNGRLNLFQSAMLHWRDLAPYNAVHVARIDEPLDRDRLQQAIDATLAAYGVAGFELDRASERFTYHGGAMRAAIDMISAGDDAEATLAAEIEARLNADYPVTGRYEPWKFFAIEMTNAFHLGVGYDHVVAAGDSISVLLLRIVIRYRAGAESARFAPPDLYPATYGPILRKRRRELLGGLIRGLPRLPAMIASLRRAFRPQFPYGDHQANGFALVRVSPERATAMRRAAKAWGITRNDLMLALTMRMLSEPAAGRHAARRRRELAVASIVNIRGDCGDEAADAFGQFLSSFLVTHPVPPTVGLETLARELGERTTRMKRDKLYLLTLPAMAIGGRVVRSIAPGDRARFYRKSYPVWGGMTPLDVDLLWASAGGQGPPPDYARGVSTGPHTPLVVAMTSAAGGLNIGLTYRTAAWNRSDIAKMTAVLTAGIAELPP